MNITFYKKDNTDSFTIRPFISNAEKPSQTCVWVQRESGEGGQFDCDAIADVIYEALDKYFNENF